MNAITGQNFPALARGVRMQTDVKSGEPVLLFPEGVLFLNPTAHEVVTRCDGQTTVDAIVLSLAEEYEADAATLRADVLDCLAELRQRKLLVLKP